MNPRVLVGCGCGSLRRPKKMSIQFSTSTSYLQLTAVDTSHCTALYQRAPSLADHADAALPVPYPESSQSLRTTTRQSLIVFPIPSIVPLSSVIPCPHTGRIMALHYNGDTGAMMGIRNGRLSAHARRDSVVAVILEPGLAED